jgi:uracil-DNA glycosylase family 4
MLLPKPTTCQGCPLYSIGRGFSKPEGKGSLPLLLVGEALGENEANDGLPFRPNGQAGAMLERAMGRVGIKRDMVRLWNVVACQPPKNVLLGASYEVGAISHCSRHFDMVVDGFNPKVMLALGGIPARTLTGLAGEKLGVTNIRGYVIPSPKYPGVSVVPTYHPAFLARGFTKYLGVLQRDIQLAVTLARGNNPTPPQADFYFNPPIEKVREEIKYAIQNPHLHIHHDCETMESLATLDESEVPEHFQQIYQFQFAVGPNRPVFVLPYSGEYISLIADALATPNPKVAWNGWRFDRNRYREHGLVMNGTDHDAMALWHHFQPDLPRGLQYSCSFVPSLVGIQPWKHISQSDHGFYGWADIHYMRENFYYHLQALEKKGMRNSYDNLVIDFQSVVLDKMKDRGIPINELERLAFGEKLQASCDTYQLEAQSLVSEDLKPVKQKLGLVKEPEDKTGYVLRKFNVELDLTKECQVCNGEGEIPEKITCICTDSGRDPAAPDCRICNGIGTRNKTKTKRGSDITVTVTVRCKECKGKGFLKTGEKKEAIVERWAKLESFNLGSRDQIIAAIEAAGLKPPKDFEDPDKATLGKKELDRFLKKVKNPNLKRLLELRLSYQEVDKLKGTYVEGWKPDSNTGCVHAEFGQWTGTAQLTANNPNVLTLPKRGSLANDFRGLIYAPSSPDRMVIVERDYTAAHALTLGHLAKSRLYLNLARNDIHGFMTLHAMRKPEADRSIELAISGTKDSLAELKKIIKHYRANDPAFELARNFKSKPAILGIGFKMGVKKLYNENKEGFANLAEAEYFWNIPRKLAPEVFKFQDDICNQAYQQGHLISDFKFIRWFWDVFKWDPKVKAMRQSEGAEDAVAFLPANHAFGVMREALLKMHYQEDLLNKFNLINIVHDAVWFLCKWKGVEECLYKSKVYMEEPNVKLANELTPDGLYIGTEATVGFDLRKAKVVEGIYQHGMVEESELTVLNKYIEDYYNQTYGVLVEA